MNGEEENKEVVEEIVATDVPEETSAPQADEGNAKKEKKGKKGKKGKKKRDKDMAEEIFVTDSPEEPSFPQVDEAEAQEEEKKRKLSVEGIRKVEVMGPYEWEEFATAILQNGRYFEASADHYSAGSYDVNGKVFTMDLQLHQHGKLRTLFGEKEKQVSVRFEGKIKKNDKIVGKAISPRHKKYDLRLRLSRLSDLD